MGTNLTPRPAPNEVPKNPGFAGLLNFSLTPSTKRTNVEHLNFWETHGWPWPANLPLLPNFAPAWSG
jgi:hypothetical protein